MSWRKLENEKGFFYYINESTNIKQWNHPKFGDIIQQVEDYNYIKYSVYRIATKFRVLQHAFFMNEVPLSVVISVFDQHKLGATEGGLTLQCYDLEAVVTDIYFTANKQSNTNTDIDFATELMLNFLYNVYDKDRWNNIQVFSAKLVLALLSKYKIADLYNFIFNLCADHNNCVTRLKLQMFLSKFIDVAKYLHEDVNFGHHLLKVTIASCFNNSPGLIGISQSDFMAWLGTCPQLLAWIPTLHRIKAAEHVIHVGKCSVCKVSPLLGLRYRCTKCSSYLQCQNCFFSAKINYSHKLTHPMKEYCTEGTSQVVTHTFIKKVCRFLSCSVKLNAHSLAPNIVESTVLSNNNDRLISLPEFDSACNTNTLSHPEIQLQLIIKQLDLRNRELEQMIIYNSSNDKEMKKYLEEHRLQVAMQIQKLKDYLRSVQFSVNTKKTLKHSESTPLLPNAQTAKRSGSLDLLSPINQMSYDVDNQNYNENDENHFHIATNSMPSYSFNNISTWIAGCSLMSNKAIFQGSNDSLNSINTNQRNKSPGFEMHNDLDEVLAKLQQILANNFMFDDNNDTGQLKNAVTEVEGMLTSLIDGVENIKETTTQDQIE